jgi:hypothetical protein
MLKFFPLIATVALIVLFGGLLASPSRVDWYFDFFALASVGLGALLYVYAELFAYSLIKRLLSVDPASQRAYLLLAAVPLLTSLLYPFGVLFVRVALDVNPTSTTVTLSWIVLGTLVLALSWMLRYWLVNRLRNKA